MAFWIFKVSDKGGYPDVPGETYAYDNTHSVRVSVGDEFIYLDKSGRKYGLTGAGSIASVSHRPPNPSELRAHRVDRVFTAHLSDVVWFSELFSLSAQTTIGKANRTRLGLPDDLNQIGWSISMPRLTEHLFRRLLDAALSTGSRPANPGTLSYGPVEDSWSLVRQRSCAQYFRSQVLIRHDFRCLVCGTRLPSVLDAAHIRAYAQDPNHRANPANGLCLCRFCHAAFDAGDILILQDGRVLVDPAIQDEIAHTHFHAVDAETRKAWLREVDSAFLSERSCQTGITRQGVNFA